MGLKRVSLLDMGEYDPLDDAADQTKKGWLTSILELGAWLGALLSGFVAEVLSRKYGIMVATAVFILGVLVQAVRVFGLWDHFTASNSNPSAPSRLGPTLFLQVDSLPGWESVLWPPLFPSTTLRWPPPKCAARW